MQTGWQKIGDSEYYFNEKGIMQTGWQQVDGYWYYFNEKGVIQTGWQQISGSWYHLKYIKMALHGQDLLEVCYAIHQQL
ncbi:MAG: hypothetical protein V8R81_07515 [Clostridia bacterium]